MAFSWFCRYHIWGNSLILLCDCWFWCYWICWYWAMSNNSWKLADDAVMGHDRWRVGQWTHLGGWVICCSNPGCKGGWCGWVDALDAKKGKTGRCDITLNVILLHYWCNSEFHWRSFLWRLTVLVFQWSWFGFAVDSHPGNKTQECFGEIISDWADQWEIFKES